MISNQIAFHMKSSLNWGLAAAMGSILLVAVLILYYLYDKVVGIDTVSYTHLTLPTNSRV